MSEEEIKICPPLLLIGSDEMLAGQGLGQLIWLLNSGLPVKILVLNNYGDGMVRQWQKLFYDGRHMASDKSRMAYDRVVPVVDITARLLGRALNQRG